VGISEVRLC